MVLRALKNIGKVFLNNPKSGRGRLRELFITSLSHSSNGVSQRWSKLELVAYESGRKENFDGSNKSNGIET